MVRFDANTKFEGSVRVDGICQGEVANEAVAIRSWPIGAAATSIASV